jgi:group I intron endonuclease
MNIYTIYKITNIQNGKIYIGFTSNHKTRFYKHVYDSLNLNPKQHIHRALRKYGKEKFTFDILYQSLEREHTLKTMEPFFINEYNTFKNGYNMTKGGEGVFGIPCCDFNKRRMYSNNPGKTKSALQKKTSIIEAVNELTNEIVLIVDRMSFSREYGIPYTTIGWAIQHNKTLKSGWQFTYIKKRTMGA